MDSKYKKWEALEKECAAEEQAELAAKKAERDRRKAERQQGRGVKGGSGDPIRDAYEQAFENKKGEMKITREVRLAFCVPLRSSVLTVSSHAQNRRSRSSKRPSKIRSFGSS